MSIYEDLSVESCALDDLVHREFESQAAEINNEGKRAQLDYLISRGWTEQDIMEAIFENNED